MSAGEADTTDAKAQEAKKPPRRRMEFFSMESATPVPDEMMPREGVDESVLAGLAKFAAVGGREGVGEKTVLLFKEDREDGMSLLYAWFKSGYVLPRHSHSGDCLYVVVGGELRIGARVLRKGDGMFIPGGHAYGYEAGPDGVEVLEFRNATHFNLLFRGNDPSHWTRVAETFRDRSALWEQETPPSDR